MEAEWLDFCRILCHERGTYVCIMAVQQGGSTSDGFLSSAEYAVWESTMKLDEHEGHPTLKQSYFMSIPSDPPIQVSFGFLSVSFLRLKSNYAKLSCILVGQPDLKRALSRFCLTIQKKLIKKVKS